MWRLFCLCLFLLAPSFGTLGRLCFVTVAFLGYFHLFVLFYKYVFFLLCQIVVCHRRQGMPLLVLLQQHTEELRQSPVPQDMKEQLVLQLFRAKTRVAGQLPQDVLLKVHMQVFLLRILLYFSCSV